MSPFVGRVLLYVVDGPAKPVVPSLSSKMNIPMFRPLSAFAFVLAIGLSASACDSDDPTGPTEEAPVAVTETFSGTVTLNGAVRHEFVTQRADRKSTRLNSSHSQISYAVFCLKKKKQTT